MLILLRDEVVPRSEQDRDARTVLAALTAERMTDGLYTVAELHDAESREILEMAGVEEIVVGGTHKSQGAVRIPLLEFNPVTILTDDETVSFGDSLPEPEAQYLGQLVRAVLSS